MREVHGDGPATARIMVVGEAPGADEERVGKPFVGASGWELDRMLGEAGISRGECFVTNVARIRPPNNDITAFIAKSQKAITDEHREYRGKWVLPPILSGAERLEREIALVKPAVIVALGNTPLWALTGNSSITKWRGSCLHLDNDASKSKVIPTYHPAAILRQWSWRAIAVADLRRAARFRDGHPYPDQGREYLIRPTLEEAVRWLQDVRGRLEDPTLPELRISFDIETRAGHISCAGLTVGNRGLCIPLMESGRLSGYWPADDEAWLIWLLAQVLTHPRASVVGQNIIYDSQYTYRWWGFVPRVTQDTMIAQHSVFSDQPKSLAHIASMYCDYYVYWKDEGKQWKKGGTDDQYWRYNLDDCFYTDEAGRAIEATAIQLGLSRPYAAQQRLFWPVLAAMQRGIRVDKEQRSALAAEVRHEVARRKEFITQLLGHPLNPGSSKQMQALFYHDLKQQVILKKGKKGAPSKPTLDEDALQTIAKREPLLKPLVNAISDIRTLGIFANMLSVPLDSDGRMRCAYNIGGSESGKSAPYTYRMSSSENAFGSGTNLQNIPSEKSKSLGKAAARGPTVGLGDPYQYPNLRSMFIPDPGHLFFDGDLDRADLQVVVWEADDAMLKAALRQGCDIHLMNAFILEGKDPPPLEELVDGHPRYPDHRGPRKHGREFAKSFCHGTNYGGKPPTMAKATGRTIHEIDRAQRIWFGAHPGIRGWHDRVSGQISARRFVENRFGYRWYIFDRPEAAFTEALAWIPQSTVANLINLIWLKLYEEVPAAQVLGQVHDSLIGQIPEVDAPATKKLIETTARITIPYEDPLTIPFSVKLGSNWGACA